MADSNVPVSATQAVTRMQMSITAAYNAAGDAITSNIPTEQLEIINIRSAQWPIDYRIDTGPWQSIQELKSRVLVADLSTQTVRIRRGLNAPATLVVDLVLYAKPSGLKSGQGASVDIFTPAKVAAIDALVSKYGKRAQVPFKLWGQMQTSAGLLGVTNHATYEVPFDWIALRLHVENMAAVATINKLCAVAVSNDGTAAPTVPSGAWNNVLFSATALHTATACTNGAGTNNAVPTDLVSDWLTLPSIARTDGGTGRILMVRDYLPAAGNTLGNRCDIANTGIGLSVAKVKAWQKSGDFVTTPAGFTTPSEWGMVPAIWFEFLTASGAIVLLACGDSTVQGADGGPMPNVGGAARLASELQPGLVALANEGWSSQTSMAYYANALAKLTALKPAVAFYCPWSPNDTDKYTAAGITRMQQQALAWVEACRAVDCAPVLLTPCPMNGLILSEENFRRQIVDWVKTVCAAGVATLADRDAVYTDYTAATGGFKAGLNQTTQHPNPTGYALEAAQVWAPILR